MGRYFFHLHDGDRLLEDHEGLECETPDTAEAFVVDTARDVMVGEIRAGRLNLGWYILISDAENATVRQVSFGDAVTVAGL